jgi:hypothetical protein
MYMVFIDGDLKPGKKNEFLKAWSSQILPLLKKQDGFVDEILLREDGSEKPCGLSFWKPRSMRSDIAATFSRKRNVPVHRTVGIADWPKTEVVSTSDQHAVKPFHRYLRVLPDGIQTAGVEENRFTGVSAQQIGVITYVTIVDSSLGYSDK